MDREVDVLVIGAGPGGSLCAKHAALGGARTLLIEKRQEIGTPVRCGEGVGRTWLSDVRIPPAKDFIAREVEASRVIAPDGTTFVAADVAGMKGGYIVERDLFDRYLAKEAAKAGAEILIKTTATGLLFEGARIVGARCEHMGESFDVRAKVVIGADGFESQVGRWAGLGKPLRTRDIVSCLQYTLAGIEGESSWADFHIGTVAPGGYAWVFWKADDVANVGLGIPLSRLHDAADTKRYLDRFIAGVPNLARGAILEEVAGGLSASLPLERSVAPGLLLVGDAARLIDPLTGAGIQNALLSGLFAGETAAMAVRSGDASEAALLGYDRRWRARMEEDLARHYILKEALQKLDDEAINKIVRAIVEAKIERYTADAILNALRTRCPEVLVAFEGLI
jgi:digeranylgeranylglycerophospholipid reductase